MSEVDPASAGERPAGRGLLARVAIDLTPLRVSPPFRNLWFGQAIGLLAWRIVGVAVPVQVWDLTESPFAVGLVALTQFVPLVTLTIVGGAVADTVERRRLLLWQSVVIVAAFAGLTINAGLEDPSLGACFALSLLAWSAFSFSAGAFRSLIPRIVPADQLTAAVALQSLSGNLGSVAGPAVAGVAIAQLGLRWTYAVAVAGAVGAIWGVLVLPRISPLGGVARMTLRSLLDGFRYVGAQRVVLAFFLIDTVAMIFGMPNALFPALAEEVFDDPASVGWLYSAPAAGALAASVSSGWVTHVRRQGVAIVLAASAWGVAIAAFGFARSLWVALLLLAVAGAADQVSAIFRSTIVLTVTPDHLRGRLGGIEFAQVAAAPALGNVEAGAVASLTSLRFSIVSGGVACVIGTLLIALTFPALLRYDAKRAEARA